MSDARPFDMPPQRGRDFDPQRGAWVIRRLMGERDLDFTNIIHPAAIVGNLGGESRLTAIQEVSPISGRGGFGWEQATGPRRVAFEKFAAEMGLTVTDDEANYEFLTWELRGDPNVVGDGSEHRALERLKQTTTLESAVYVFEVAFERPASTADVGSRVHYAQRALAVLTELPEPSGPTWEPPEPTPPDPDNSANELNRLELGRILRGELPLPPISTPAPIQVAPPPIAVAPAVPAPMAPARTAPGVAIAGGSGFVANLAATIQYAGPWNWPLAAPTELQALSVAGFFVYVGAIGFHLWANRVQSGRRRRRIPAAAVA